MAAGSPSRVLRCLRRAALRDLDALADGPLLEAFVVRRDEEAFAALVRRHGPMVWGVCRRVVGHTQDAEDAFQAAFLVLARKAATVRPREQVGNWLYGVACRVAMKAKSLSLRRRTKEKQVIAMPHPTSDPPEAVDWLPLLDRELAQLPDKYRLPIVLCDLEGRTRRDVARQLKLPDGTLSNRLAAGRRMLADRLTRHGVMLSGGALAVAMAAEARAVPAVLADSAARLVSASAVSAPILTLSEGVLKAMLLNKLKTATAALAVVALAAAGLGGTMLPTPMAAADTPVAATPAKPAEKPVADRDRLQGTWVLIAGSVNGTKMDAVALKKEEPKWVFAGDRMLALRADQPGRHHESSFLVDSRREPKTLDRVPADGPDKGKICPGIYQFLNDFLIVCDNAETKERPAKFHSEQGNPGRILVFHREDSAKGETLTDEEFLKRACMAMRGVEMTHLEKTYFLADKDANKRAKVLGWLTGGTQVQWLNASYWRSATQLPYGNFTYPQLINNTMGLGLNNTYIGFANQYSNPTTLLWANQPNRNGGLQTNSTDFQPNFNSLPYALVDPKGRITINELSYETAEVGDDDAQFLRRLMLDMFGVLPTVLESNFFVADTDSNKREKVAKWLTEAPLYKQHIAQWYRAMDKAQQQTIDRSIANAWQARAAANVPDRLDQLLNRLLSEKKSDEQTLEALYLATMARYPTDDAKHVILAQVAKQTDRAAAWKDVLHALTQSSDSREYLESLKRRSGR